MGLLHRHLLYAVAGACALTVGVFAFLLMAAQGLRDLLGYVLAGQIDLGTALRLLALLLPYVAVHALPVGLLTAVLLVLGRMSSQHEITAMRAAGLSLGYIARPVWLLAGLGVLASLYLNFEAMPRTQATYQQIRVDALRSNPVNFIVPKTFIREFGNQVVYAGERQGPELRDLWVWRLDKAKRVIDVVHARSGRVEFREEDNRLVLTLREVSVETRDRERPEDFSRPQPIANSDSLTVELPVEAFFGQRQSVTKKFKWMTYAELTERRDALAAKGAEATAAERRDLGRVKATLGEKGAASFAVLAFALVAVPLGIKVSRKETSANLGVAVALMLGYYFLRELTGLAEGNPDLRPELWAWLPPVIYVGAGVWLFRRLDRVG